MKDLQTARKLLEAEGFTCVLSRGDRVYTSGKRGVAPLLELLEKGEDLRGFSAADRVIGRATAMLYRLLGVTAVHGGVVSESALDALQAGGIEARWDILVPHIINRSGTGRCPMEAATAGIDHPEEALEAIKATLNKLKTLP